MSTVVEKRAVLIAYGEKGIILLRRNRTPRACWTKYFGRQVDIINTGGADKSLARPGRKQATATEDFEFHISYL